MKKKVIIVVVIIVLMILLVPIPFKLRDGGTVEWKSLTYSIANVHSIYAVGNESNKYELGYKEGIVIKIFNMTVYNNTKYSLKEEFAIIDNSKEFDCNNIEEEIYRDDEYIYYLPCEKSQYIKVIYAPNEYQEGLKSSLAEGNIKISDLDKFNYECEDQIDIFDLIRKPISITKPIRLIELFAGYGSQAMALRDIGAKFEHYRVVEFDKYAITSYNAVHGTDFQTMDITKVHASDLNICDTEKYCYFMTYSFPCTDLSVAGKQAGMKKGSGTRSGLLWEVERILREIKESGGELPQILFMENVPQVHADANKTDFQNWIDFLTDLGYVSYWKDLNAKNYGVAQNRNRCFMFSFLGEFNYKFPKPIPLEKRLKDYLEDSVDEKYYIDNEKTQKLIRTLIDNGTLQNTMLRTEQVCVDGTIKKPKKREVANCIKARYDCGISSLRSDGNLVVNQSSNAD